ncbi:hypothetical protein [Mycobacterium alsense]|uniref:hypothetical protein n=1 Tax=Mycobacterium alsense TaxID=324058 RepID=UPI0009EDBE27|nr:hypothetical protein [Mycobacterium alsense]
MTKLNRALQLVGEADADDKADDRADGVPGDAPGEAESTGDDDTTEPKTEATSEDSTASGRRWTRRAVLRWLAVAGVVVVVALSVTAAVVLGWKLKTQRAVADAGQQALVAAQQYAVALTSVDSNKLDENFAAVLNGATGEFKDMYSQSSAQLKQLLLDNKANSHGTVVAAGIKSATKDKVEVMLFVDQSVTNTLNPQPRMDRSRIIVTMERVNGRWLASKVDLP